MPKPIVGLHHVTAIASDAQSNLDFYTQVLGLRFVKRTVNFDDPRNLPSLLRRRRRLAGDHPHLFPLAPRQPRPRRRR